MAKFEGDGAGIGSDFNLVLLNGRQMPGAHQ